MRGLGLGLLLLCCPIGISPPPHLHQDTAELPCDTADAAGYSPKAASAAENVPWHATYSRAQGAGGDCWPKWGSRAIESFCHHLLRCTRRSEIVIARSIRDGLRGAYRCITRRFWKSPAPGRNHCAQCSAMNRISCCCSAAQSCNSLHPLPASDRWITPATRQMQLAADPKLLPPSAMAHGILHMTAHEVQGRQLA